MVGREQFKSVRAGEGRLPLLLGSSQHTPGVERSWDVRILAARRHGRGVAHLADGEGLSGAPQAVTVAQLPRAHAAARLAGFPKDVAVIRLAPVVRHIVEGLVGSDQADELRESLVTYALSRVDWLQLAKMVIDGMALEDEPERSRCSKPAPSSERARGTRGPLIATAGRGSTQGQQ